MHPQRLSKMRNREKTDYLLMVPKIKKSCLSALEAICAENEIEAVPLGSKIDVLPGTNMHLYMNNLGDRVSSRKHFILVATTQLLSLLQRQLCQLLCM